MSRDLRAWALAVACLAGCSERGVLTGSIAGQYSLDFDAVHAYFMDEDLVIAFTRELQPRRARHLGSNIANQVVRLTLAGDRQALEADVDLPFVTPEGQHVASVDHYVILEGEQDDLLQDENFPDLAEGKLHLTAFSRERGKQIAGDFDCTFVDGRQLSGSMDTRLGKP